MHVATGPVTGECTAEETDLNLEQNIAYTIEPKLVTYFLYLLCLLIPCTAPTVDYPPTIGLSFFNNTIYVQSYAHMKALYKCVHRCSQLESAIPMVNIYDDVFGDIDHTYSTIPDIDTTNDQQRYYNSV